jgi:hypothetical protein
LGLHKRARLVQAGVLPNPHLELANKNDALFKNNYPEVVTH